MCKCLKISRSLFYYSYKRKKSNSELENSIITIFEGSKNNYGSRKIKYELDLKGYKVSRKKIRKIMLKHGLVSNYTVKNFKLHKTKCNEDKIENVVDRNFNQESLYNVIVSDLTYVNINGKWNYICIILDLCNREIIGYSAGENKTAELVYEAFSKINIPLSKIGIFHTDRGSEFKNSIIEGVLKTFKIKRSLSKKGCPYDNAVAESTFKIVKTEFVNNDKFSSIEDLQVKLFDYVNWYNNYRIHGALKYKTPIEYKKEMSE
jgi:transposase InsO family protein